MAKQLNQEFLEIYREFENTLREQNPPLTIYEYESQSGLSENDNKKLQIIRLIRNYLSHQDTNFVEASKEMISYLKNQTETIRRRDKTAKDIMSRATSILENTKIIEAAAKLTPKKPFLVITNKNKQITGLFTYETVCIAAINKNMNKSIKNSAVLKKAENLVDPDTPASGIKTPAIVIKDGIYKGIVW